MSDSSKGPLGFGHRLRELRLVRNLNQYQVAAAIGCTNSMISLWEKGDNYPAFWNLVELTRFYGVDMDWLTGMPYVRNELQQRTKIREQVKSPATSQ